MVVHSRDAFMFFSSYCSSCTAHVGIYEKYTRIVLVVTAAAPCLNNLVDSSGATCIFCSDNQVPQTGTDDILFQPHPFSA